MATESDGLQGVPAHEPETEEGPRSPTEGPNTLRGSQHLSVPDAVAPAITRLVRGWANYFRVGNSSREFDVVRNAVERKVRRFAVPKQLEAWLVEVEQRRRCTTTWGLPEDYGIRLPPSRESGAGREGRGNFDETAASRMRETRLSGSMWRGSETE